MNMLITGVAGFIGSSLAQYLLNEGHAVIGVDSLNGYYSPALKRENLESLLATPRFTFREMDVSDAPAPLFENVDTVFHLAGQPGVRSSWGASFREYIHNNIHATQVLLERIALAGTVRRIVFASSSSVWRMRRSLPRDRPSTAAFPVRRHQTRGGAFMLPV